MTDEQVKKALEACTTLRYQVGGCKQCPYEDDCNNGTQDQLYKDALALINRLEEENNRLKEQCDDIRLYGLEMANGKIDMTLGSENSKAFIHSIIQIFKQNGGKNFLTTTIECGEKLGDRYAMTIQKIGAETPYEKFRKEIVKDILQSVYEEVKGISMKDERYMLPDESCYEDSSLVNVLNIIGNPYGVEVEE